MKIFLSDWLRTSDVIWHHRLSMKLPRTYPDQISTNPSNTLVMNCYLKSCFLKDIFVDALLLSLSFRGFCDSFLKRKKCITMLDTCVLHSTNLEEHTSPHAYLYKVTCLEKNAPKSFKRALYLALDGIHTSWWLLVGMYYSCQWVYFYPPGHMVDRLWGKSGWIRRNQRKTDDMKPRAGSCWFTQVNSVIKLVKWRIRSHWYWWIWILLVLWCMVSFWIIMLNPGDGWAQNVSEYFGRSTCELDV